MQARLVRERLSNLWSRRVRHRVGRFPGANRVIRRESQEGQIPDLISPYGWEVARRSGAIDVSELRELDPTGRPDAFRRRVQSCWAVVESCEPEVVDELLLRCASAVGTPVVPREKLAGLVGDVEAWRRESFLQWSTVFDRYRLEPYWAEVGRPSVSIMLATRRPECVDIWAPIVAAQNFRPLQVVAALHGSQWTGADEERIRSSLVPSGIDVVIVRVNETKVLGEVLRAATEGADGDVLVKWDDDDLYSSTHIVDLLRARHYSGATIVGKAGDFYYLESANVTVRRVQAPREIFSPTIAGSTLMIERDDLRAVGGWDALPSREDAALIDKVRREGGASYRTVGFGFLVVRRADATAHTWNPGDGVFLATGNPRRHGLDADWAGIDVPEEVIQRVVRSARGER